MNHISSYFKIPLQSPLPCVKHDSTWNEKFLYAWWKLCFLCHFWTMFFIQILNLQRKWFEINQKGFIVIACIYTETFLAFFAKTSCNFRKNGSKINWLWNITDWTLEWILSPIKAWKNDINKNQMQNFTLNTNRFKMSAIFSWYKMLLQFARIYKYKIFVIFYVAKYHR